MDEEFLSPVSSYRRVEAHERLEQQQRLRSISTSKRKSSSPAPVSPESSKRRRRSREASPSPSHASVQGSKPATEQALPLFSRYADPSVRKSDAPVSTGFSSASTSSYTSRYVSTSASSLLDTPPSRYERLRQETTSRLTSTGGAEGVVDLDSVADVGHLEVVEGHEILQALLRSSTPRVGRRFPSEEALTDSEKRDRETLRRRRIELRSKYSAQKATQQQNGAGDGRSDEKSSFLSPTRSSAAFDSKLGTLWGSGAGLTSTKTAQEYRKIAEKREERARLEEEEAETDEETTESKINRLSHAKYLNWRHFVLWLIAGSLLLCVMVVAAPFVFKLLEPPLPYCDSEWSENGDGSYVLADPADHFDRSKALQPFIGTAAMTMTTSRPKCQPCPVYGNCLNGDVISCAPPYELQYGLCVENPEVQADLNELALNIQQFVVAKVAKNACEDMSLWGYLVTDGSSARPSDLAASIEVLLSDVQAFVTRTIAFGKAVAKLPRDYVFNRALDMALRDLKDIFVAEDQHQLFVGKSVVPWSCRAKHQLYSNVKLIALAITLGTALVFGYRQFLLYRTERQLIDRFVKEVRFFLLDRTSRPERFYPADHLRDNLFDKRSPRDRKWLCESVWPKVVALVGDDSRNVACGRTSAWGNNDSRAELRTLRGRALRRVQLFLLYGIWIGGIASFIIMWTVSLGCVVGGVWSTVNGMERTPLPRFVQVYLGSMALYESYHYVTRPSLHSWPLMRRLIRGAFVHFPYFRLNATVFDERERSKQLKDDDDEHLRVAGACKAVELNDVSPFVKPQDRAMFAFHPHGVLTNSWAFNGAHHMSFERADCRWLVAESFFWFPIIRDILNWMDQGSVAKATFQRLMPSGQNVCLLPGGFEEATLYQRGKHRVYIKKRFGFIKLALQHGYKVHPVYTFGEEFAYHTFPYLLRLRLKLNAFKLPGALFYGLPMCFFLPCTDLDLITVVGKPLLLPHIEHPTKEEVKKYHDQYVQALQELFDAYKGVYAVDPEAVLEMY
ncbi:hypothetical protein BBJ28_00002828 [Nothophytophthora sp. Chile5]|nr:hypothetical protein BBJ28_00002828 [Nothophytophthora sp. Chile5]